MQERASKKPLHPFSKKNTEPIIGRAPEDLSIPERLQHAGKWMALELYTPPRLEEEQGTPVIQFKLRRIRALGDTVEDCIRQLQQANLDPRDFEYTQITPLYKA